MGEIRLWNTATKRKDPLEPLVEAGHPKMYVCGPTVYDRAHLGNARAAVVFDVLYRLLRHEYGDGITYVRNFTDVDDKINAEAIRQREAGAPGTLEDLIRERSSETIGWYLADMGALGVLEPDHMPRATEYIRQMVAMIEGLAERGFAYAAEGHVLFRVRKYREYGALSGRSVDDMIAGARVEVAPYKEDPMDFVLWKPSDDELPGWDGPVVDGEPVGRGRPGWHIECSAMAAELLGTRFDLHGGGGDLIFPHHENEIAQSRCMGHDFARIWMHNEMLQVEGKKMSKSLGNFFTVRDLLDQGYPGEVIRFVILSTHYRKPMDWTEAKAKEAEVKLKKWRDLTNGSSSGEPDAQVVSALSDDLNTHLAISRIGEIAKEVDDLSRLEAERKASTLLASAELLGLLQQNAAMGYWTAQTALEASTEQLIERLLKERALARENKDFERADALRNGFEDAGVLLKDTPEGVSWELKPEFDKSKLEALK